MKRRPLFEKIANEDKPAGIGSNAVHNFLRNRMADIQHQYDLLTKVNGPTFVQNVGDAVRGAVASPNKIPHTLIGGGIGAIGGGIAGAIRNKKNKGRNALLGAAIGAGSGAAIGYGSDSLSMYNNPRGFDQLIDAGEIARGGEGRGARQARLIEEYGEQ